MKLARFEGPDGTSWGVLDLEARRLQPLDGPIASWAPVLVASGFRELVPAGEPVGLDDVRLLEPLEESAKVLGTGANYWAHLERLGRKERPKHLASFLKPRTAVIGPEAEIRYPALTAELDYEVELVLVLGAPVTPMTEDPVPALLGYTVGNDVSARDMRNDHGPDLISMKANDDTTPIGPWITTVDELGAPDGLAVTIRSRVNGELRQEDTTAKMLWDVREILQFFRARISLAPGDVVFTGTTCGVGMEDGRYLQAGDVVEVEVEGVGVLRNTVGVRGARG
ncbi:MAG: hydrolase family protein [Frankiales bacterium]|nr:hydrolase family protein [Frankiales bacterium]